MILLDDFRDLVVALHDEGADFVVIGGHAVTFHGHVRATKDLDVLVRATPENAARVYAALARFGAPLAQFEVAAEDFATYDGVLQLGVAPVRVDIVNRIDAVTLTKPCRRARRRRSPVAGSP